MLFNSPEYLLFLPIVFVLYWFVLNKQHSWQNVLILIASYVFYGWWSYKFLGLLAFCTLLDYCYGFGVASANKRKSKIFLWLSVINNLGILCVFKYYNFFAGELQSALVLLGLSANIKLLSVVIPIGISFYTFHGMSYVFDIYRGKQAPIRNLVDYAVFVSFFPLLVAGPIERANHLLPQVQGARRFNYQQAKDGCMLIIWGMFKKVVIADNLAPTVDTIFSNYEQASGISLIIGAVAFSFQIYGDFSGYSDIAIGTAKLLGFELLSNFRFPYFSRDIAEFWRRWHISLTSWFKDYLYIPLGGSRNGKAKTIRNTFIVFIVSGFWHGASWNFIIWGFIHACAFLPLLLLDKNRTHSSTVVAYDKPFPSLRECGQMVLTFTVVTLAWIFFRADSIEVATGYLLRMAVNLVQHPGQFLALPGYKSVFLYIVPLLALDWVFRRDERTYSIPKPLIPILTALCAIYLIANLNKGMSFIYFQF